MQQSNQPQFSSLLGFLVVIIGFAVGVGSLWRFPYVVGSNGGAIFILVYILLILMVGVPLLTAEIAIGYRSKKTAIQAYQTLTPKRQWYWISAFHIAAAIAIVSYTVPVYTWILNYLYQTAIGAFVGQSTEAINAYFGEQTKSPSMLIFAAINWILLVVVLRGGLQGGIEKASKLLLPLLAMIMLIIAVVGLSLPNGEKGVTFLFSPDWQAFTFRSLLDALGQAFFAIGIGMLASMVFGSYLSGTKSKVLNSALTICGAIVIAGVVAGLMIFPIVFAFGLNPSGGPGLTFITLPIAFNQMSYGLVLGTLFYIGFYIAAFTSALAVFEAIIGVVMATLHVSRDRALLYTLIVVVALGVPSIYFDQVFNFLDILTSQYLIVIGAWLMTIYTGYIWGMPKFLEAANVEHPLLRLWLTLSIKYICPLVIAVVFIAPFFS